MNNLRLAFIGLLFACFLVACGQDPLLPTAVLPATLPTSQTAIDPANPSPPIPTDGRALLPSLLGQTITNDTAQTAVGIVMTNPFANSTFNLQATLPPPAPETAVWRQIPQPPLSAQQAQQLAQQFGFTGPLYSQALQPTDPQNPIYYAFDGTRALIIDVWGTTYEADTTALATYQPTDFATALPIAEQFLQQYPLVDFPYVLQPTGNGDVALFRQLDGRRLNQPELVIAVNNAQQVASVSYNTLTDLQPVANYPLISAEEAWQKLQSGSAANQLDYQINDIPLPSLNQQSWHRTAPTGETVQLYGWPISYQPVGQDGPPHIQLMPYILQADAPLLDEIATAVGQQIQVTGQVDADGRTLQATAWKPADDIEPLNLEGHIRYQGEQVLFDSEDGSSYQLAQPPTDLADGTAVFIFAWQVQPTEAEPRLIWERIDALTTLGLPDEVAVDISQVNITTVELAYYVTYLFAESASTPGQLASPTLLLQPVWAFSGTAVSGHELTIFVQAVDGAFIQP